jgi:hypothetical protein
MLQQTEALRSGVETTYKAREVEGVFDLYFYRPIGFWLAQFFARLKMTPAAVSLLAGIFGVIAGHLYYYRNLSVNVAAADYYRSTYLYFVTTGARMGADSLSGLRSDYLKLTWRHTPWQKLLLALYLNFTRQQEMLAPRLKTLRDVVRQLFHGEIPDRLRTRYRDLARPMLKWWRLLMTNVRMLVLFALLFISQPVYYFWFELIPLNMLFVYLLFRQEKMAESLLKIAESSQNSA